jgi:hypothetical protein
VFLDTGTDGFKLVMTAVMAPTCGPRNLFFSHDIPIDGGVNMDMVYCPGCASGPHAGSSVCPVCGAPQVMQAASTARRNPFKLIACCCLWAIGFWLAFLFVEGFVAGVVAGGSGQGLATTLGSTLDGPLLLVAIGLAIPLTVCGKLPGTRRLNP